MDIHNVLFYWKVIKIERENGYQPEYLPEKVINEKLRQSLQSFRLLL